MSEITQESVDRGTKIAHHIREIEVELSSIDSDEGILQLGESVGIDVTTLSAALIVSGLFDDTSGPHAVASILMFLLLQQRVGAEALAPQPAELDD